MAVPSLWICVKIHKLQKQTFSNRLLIKMSGKIKPNVRQHFSVMNVPDEKGKYCVKYKHCSSELSGSTKAATNPLTRRLQY